MKKISMVALTAATLTSSFSSIASESIGMYNYCENSYIVSVESTTSNQIVDNRRFLNSILIRKSLNSLNKRLIEKKHYLSNNITNIFYDICEKCSYFDVKEVYADYSPLSNAIRLDMIINNDFLFIVRKKIEKDMDNNIAVSLSKGNELYLVDYLDLSDLRKEINYYINK